MDPNATLAQMRKLVSRILADFDSEDSVESLDAISLASNVDALDAWLSRGGFKPRPWTR